MTVNRRIKIAILSSGNGTNAENIIRYFGGHNFINIALVISNKPDARVLDRASGLGVPSKVISGIEWKNKAMVEAVLKDYGIDFIVLAGYLLLIPSWLVHLYPDRIVNIHPALLPQYGGKGMYGEHVHRAVIASGDKKSGITIHYVNEQYDGGGVIFQAECKVLDDDTPDTLAARIHTLEYEHFPAVIEKVITQTFNNP